MDNVLKTFDTDHTKPDSVETLLAILQHVIKCESFDLWQAVSSATGKFEVLIKFLIKFNQQSQESQGESVKNSLNRAALFDMTFLMLVYVTLSFGSKVVLASAPKDSFIAKWITEFMTEKDGRVKNFPKDVIVDANVDTLMQQLCNGDLRTQVVKWQNVCCSIHLAMREVIMAR